MLIIKCPKICSNEFSYILKVVFDEFLGLEFSIETINTDVLIIENSDSKNLITTSIDFFNCSSKAWLSPSSMPQQPLESWTPRTDGLKVDMIQDYVPVLYGKSGIEINDGDFHFHMDILGSVFFLLSRYEELVVLDRDLHNRFPAKASVAHIEGFLDRPLVDEYVEILWAGMKRTWPELKRKESIFSNVVSCDVDWPFHPAHFSIASLIRGGGAALYRDRSIHRPLKMVNSYLRRVLGLDFEDSYRDALSWIMDVNEKLGNRVAFYFIADHSSKLDSNFDLSGEYLQELITEITQRGHEIGIHPGYNTFNDPILFKKSVDSLKTALKKADLPQDNIGGRQHYLRYDIGITPLLWENNGLTYDSSLGYADSAGFRCGTCREYSMYDLLNRNGLKLKQKPLVAMEASIISNQYEALGHSELAIKRFLDLKKSCEKMSGHYNLLWHNSNLVSKADKDIYIKILS
ncbi:MULTISPECIES: polysaccharide deacetylase family protein [unclassified Colwellia]|uniref:polysaccharide deacetylase family protein n=1 Tax=unclassified Colwellia TaxID=196834 RepID=UPI0015F4634F|nr:MULTISPECIES: polysaccharide deacetylase family protein [unclassified Colwellia]MBA6257121.1 polysaccharide deacetylase family protein [Colwellia sp. MB3u-28]MBA6258647.1 polysaccharide deacetylase family protein [Colwellia sp. MB3u-41]